MSGRPTKEADPQPPKEPRGLMLAKKYMPTSIGAIIAQAAYEGGLPGLAVSLIDEKGEKRVEVTGTRQAELVLIRLGNSNPGKAAGLLLESADPTIEPEEEREKLRRAAELLDEEDISKLPPATIEGARSLIDPEADRLIASGN